MVDSVSRLYQAVLATREGRNPSPRTGRLFDKGRAFIAKKLAEEAVEVALEAALDDRRAAVRESADLIYNLAVLWVDMDIRPEDVWAEMRRREQLLGMAEKLPKRGEKPDAAKAGSSGLRHERDGLDVALADAGPEIVGEPRELPPARPRR
ncbi:phosphoribosyl-ATP diphosphatase [Ancylobacter sp. 6x-1]|uniref:phosphoribosyl-ATP diphosphatase n=1 Tax=Ancylobacter crimeensis TaxID=2579147 RepID=A0ABT0DDV8_9HYPH|nr:phosphoribosyl-ATP diphosphatase [Ancylobacter crimeensis]MCK0198049.1 phosphoribosyl-ATP diphosphatase [Ancylobacter crimeensis]